MAVFIAGAEEELTSKISDPSNMVQAGMVLKCIKTILAISIFTMNGATNDYFVSLFFIVTSLCGVVYLRNAGYNVPEKP